MTRPQPLPDLIAAHDAVALAAEAAAVTAVTAPVEAAFTGVWQWLLARWAQLLGPPATVGQGPPLRTLLDDASARITAIDVDRGAALLEYAQRARNLGADQGAREAAVDGRDVERAVDVATVDAATRTVERAQEKLHRAAVELDRLDEASLPQVLDQASIGRQAMPILAQAARTTFNSELNGGIAAAAMAAGAQLLWVAERDACLVCTSLSGHVVPAGDTFPDGRQFGQRRGAFAPVTAPPMHPNCRCRVSPWRGHDADAAARSAGNWDAAIAEARARGDRVAERAALRAAAASRAAAAAIDYPAALRREAERAVLRGDSAFDAEQARLTAADRLLMRIGAAKNSRSPSGWHVPGAVKAKSSAAVRRGQFSK